jgi:hypothetical protein
MNNKKIQTTNSSNFIGNNNFSSHVHTSLFNTLNILIQIKMEETTLKNERTLCTTNSLPRKKKKLPPLRGG